MNRTIIVIYTVTMLLLVGSWLYLQTQTVVTTTCYEFDKEIPCDLAYQKQTQFLPNAPDNWTFNMTIP